MIDLGPATPTGDPQAPPGSSGEVTPTQAPKKDPRPAQGDPLGTEDWFREEVKKVSPPPDIVCQVHKISLVETQKPKPEDKSTELEIKEDYFPEEHVVDARDTLDKVAARYNTTPSQLAAYNKLSSRFIFAGQILKLPPPEPEKPPTPPPQPVSVKKVIVEDPEIIDSQFLRINVRHITDGAGVVIGSLLVTPKVLMFNPNLSDPLVEESEPDKYQIIAPLELVMNTAIFDNFIQSAPGVDVSAIFTPEESEMLKTEDGFFYLRVVMGKPIGKKLPRSSPIVSYGEQSLEPEYWFIVSREKCFHIFKFFQDNFPCKYGHIDRVKIEKNGYELIRDKNSVVEAEAGRTCNRASVSKIIKKTMTMTSIEFSTISEMIGESELMTNEERLQLARELPPRTDGCNWVLKFSTSHDGFTLNSLMRRVAGIDGPVLLLLSDLSGSVFGAFLSDAPTFSEHFQGTGETFIFSLKPEYQIYQWTGENNYFYKVDQTSLIVGSGDGKFGLWLDADLNQGHTNACSTFDSLPLTATEDFTLKTLECWGFEM